MENELLTTKLTRKKRCTALKPKVRHKTAAKKSPKPKPKGNFIIIDNKEPIGSTPTTTEPIVKRKQGKPPSNSPKKPTKSNYVKTGNPPGRPAKIVEVPKILTKKQKLYAKYRGLENLSQAEAYIKAYNRNSIDIEKAGDLGLFLESSIKELVSLIFVYQRKFISEANYSTDSMLIKKILLNQLMNNLPYNPGVVGPTIVKVMQMMEQPEDTGNGVNEEELKKNIGLMSKIVNKSNKGKKK